MVASPSCSLATVATVVPVVSVSTASSLRSTVRARVLAVLAAAAVFTGSADAHGYLTVPAAEFTEGKKTEYSATMSPVFEGKFNGNPQENVDTFTTQFEAHKYKYPDLKTLVSGQGKDCGYTNEFATPKPIPSDGVVVFQNPDSGEGFVPSHTVSLTAVGYQLVVAVVLLLLLLSSSVSCESLIADTHRHRLVVSLVSHATAAGTVRDLAGRHARVPRQQLRWEPPGKAQGGTQSRLLGMQGRQVSAPVLLARAARADVASLQ